MRAVTGPDRQGRWVWTVSGAATAAALAVPAVLLIGRAGVSGAGYGGPAERFTQVISQPVTTLTVDSAGSPVRVRAGQVSRVSVTATVAAAGPGAKPGMAPALPVSAVPVPAGTPVKASGTSSGTSSMASSVTQSVSGGRLTLGVAPGCRDSGCAVTFDVTVPADVTATVTSEGGPVLVSGLPGASVISGGGAVSAQGIDGGLSVSSGEGPVIADDVTGTLNLDSDGGTVQAQDLTAATATVTTEGGPAVISFATAPRAVTVRTGGGTARLDVPGGPYAMTADSGGGPLSLGVATDPAASRSITISTAGGPLILQP